MNAKRKMRVFLLTHLAAASVALLLLGTAHGDVVGSPISVGANPVETQMSPDGSRVYVSDKGTLSVCPYPTGAVSIINTATNGVTTTPVGIDPGPIRFAPDGSKAYVVNQSDCDANGSVSVVSVASGTVVNTVPVGNSPVTLSVANDGSRVYVVNKGSNSVSVICTGLVSAVCASADTVIHTIALDATKGVQPHVIDKNPSGSEVWVPQQDCPAITGCTSGNVAVISTATDSVISNVTVGPNAGSIRFTPDGARAYVATRGNGSLAIAPTVVDVNASTHMVSNTITITPPGFPTDAAPHAMRVTPDNSKLYVVNKHANDVAVICTGKVPSVCAGMDAVLTYAPVGDSPVRVQLTDSGGRAYIVNEAPSFSTGSLSVICTGLVSCGGPATDTVMSTMTLGNRPVDMEVDCVNSKVYVSNSRSNNVSTITMTGAALCSTTPTPTATGQTATATATPIATGTTTAAATGTPTATVTPTATPTPTSTPAGQTPTPSPSPSDELGNVDCVNGVTTADALALLEELAGVSDKPPCNQDADVDCSGGEDMLDVLNIARYAARLPRVGTVGANCRAIGT